MKNNHTTFRNGDLFCTHCGRTKSLPLPISTRVFTAYCEDFDEQHRFCKKTWTQPMPDGGASEYEKAQFWLRNGDRGISSETIFSELYLPVRAKNNYCHPLDPDDFRRCYLLIQMVPEWRAKLSKMKEVSEAWSRLVDNWDKLTEMLEEQLETKKPNGMYEFMKELGC